MIKTFFDILTKCYVSMFVASLSVAIGLFPYVTDISNYMMLITAPIGLSIFITFFYS